MYIYLRYRTFRNDALIFAEVRTAAKVFLSDSDDLTTSAIGSCGIEPGPEPFNSDRRCPSSIGVWLEVERYKLVCRWLTMLSTLDRQRFRELTVCGGATDLAKIRARYGSPAFKGVLEGMAPSSV